jgi:hypothetical protein
MSGGIEGVTSMARNGLTYSCCTNRPRSVLIRCFARMLESTAVIYIVGDIDTSGASIIGVATRGRRKWRESVNLRPCCGKTSGLDSSSATKSMRWTARREIESYYPG